MRSTPARPTDLAFSSATTAGNSIVIAVLWNNAGTVSVADNRGNTYTSATARTAWGNNWSSQVFYATNIAGGATTVTATFGTPINDWGIIYIHEYAGLGKRQSGRCDEVGDRDWQRDEQRVRGDDERHGPPLRLRGVEHRVTAAGSGYTTRSTAYGNRTQDRTVSATGNYAATATQNGNAWVMQLVAFRADDGHRRHRPAERADRPHRHGRVHDADQLGVEPIHRQRRRDRLSHRPQRHPGSDIDDQLVPGHRSRARDDLQLHRQRVRRGREQLCPIREHQRDDAGAASRYDTAPRGRMSAPAGGRDGLGNRHRQRQRCRQRRRRRRAVPARRRQPRRRGHDRALLDLMGHHRHGATDPHSLTARARDAAGNSATSATSSVTVVQHRPRRLAGRSAATRSTRAAGTTAADASGHGLTGTLDQRRRRGAAASTAARSRLDGDRRLRQPRQPERPAAHRRA